MTARKTTAGAPASPATFFGFRPEAEEEGQVAAYATLVEAEMARGRLEAAGIPSRVVDGHTVSMVQVLSAAVGGVKVCVATDDMEEARAVLQSPASIVDDAAENDDDEDDDVPASTASSASGSASKEDLALRSFRASMIGFVVVPPLLHLWSAWLLVEYARAPGTASPRARRRAASALVVDVVVAGAAVFILQALLR